MDNPVRHSLAGAHAALGSHRGAAARYAPEVSPFVGVPDTPGPGDWADLAELLGRAPGSGPSLFIGMTASPPPDWEVVRTLDGVQLVGEQVRHTPDPEAVRLGPADVPEMLDLAERTRPGPFRTRTVEMGLYLGLRHRGRLVAMAGERLRPPGWTEVSAVCTDPDFRGRGLGGRLVLAVAAGILERGETPFLHAARDNTGALRLYEALGFRLRRATPFVVTRPGPGAAAT
ncbi:GNAT family N-acetyltransferase [Streptomyces sp. TR06-5]|uniref:GNAT family N-acetyltransferase n=1 Tax=unclassified Streptomyces TaxID=2593676 RepID=UPI0039A05B06